MKNHTLIQLIIVIILLGLIPVFTNMTFITIIILYMTMLMCINLNLIFNIKKYIRYTLVPMLNSIKLELFIILILGSFFTLFVNYPLGYIFYLYVFIVIILFIYFIYLLVCLGLSLSFLSILLIFLTIISSVFYFFPLIMFITLGLAGLFSVVFSCFYEDFFSMSRSLFKRFYSFQIIKFFVSLDHNLFYTTTNEHKFDHLCYLLGFFSLSYIMFAKIYVIFSIKPNFNHINSFDYKLLSLTIFICLFVYLLKSFLNFCRVLSLGYQYYFIMNPDVPEVPPEIPNKIRTQNDSSVINYGGFFNRHTHTHYHSYPTRISRFFTLNRTIGVCTLGLGCVGLYYTIRTYNQSVEQTHQLQEQTRQAQEQTRQAQEQTKEMRRMNDLSELSQGIITKDEYNRRHPPVSLASFYEFYLFRISFIYYVILLIKYTLVLLVLTFVTFMVYSIIIYFFCNKKINKC